MSEQCIPQYPRYGGTNATCSSVDPETGIPWNFVGRYKLRTLKGNKLYLPYRVRII